MTTNAGSERKDSTVGFNRTLTEQGKDKSEKALHDFLRPEFINRVDEIVYFNKLSEENFKDIARLMLEELRTAMLERQIDFRFDETILDYLKEKSFSATYGARNLRRAIQKEIEDVVASELIRGYSRAVTHISVAVVDGKVQLIAV
jgi:ATP-dependent Clp protease ATP-binding subunit ClpA